MNWNWSQFFALWIAAALLAAAYAARSASPQIGTPSLADPDALVRQAARSGDGSARIVAGRLATLLGDPDAINAASAATDPNNPVPFSDVAGTDGEPILTAIVIENGAPLVYIRNDDGTIFLTEGDEWNGWLIERIDPARVYFSRSGEDYEYFAFATLQAVPNERRRARRDRQDRNR